MNKFGDLKTDEEKSAFFWSGRGYETGVIAATIQNDVAMAYHRCAEYKKELAALQAENKRLRAEIVLADREVRQQDKPDAARWRYIRRKLCLTGNGDGTCAMQAINLPAAIQGWPEPGQVAEFCDAAIDAALSKENKA